jgi:hypothetical protein
VLAALAAFHGLLILCVSSRDAGWLIAHRLTLLPAWLAAPADKVQTIAMSILAQQPGSSTVVRKALNTYLHAAGIERGYGYFAPNVPDAYKLVFELHHADGEVTYQAAGTETGESSLRFASLMDYLGRTASDADRRFLAQLLTQSLWGEHNDVVKIRCILGSITIAPPAEFRKSNAATYEFCCAYEFARPPEPSP